MHFYQKLFYVFLIDKLLIELLNDYFYFSNRIF